MFHLLYSPVEQICSVVSLSTNNNSSSSNETLRKIFDLEFW